MNDLTMNDEHDDLPLLSHPQAEALHVPGDPPSGDQSIHNEASIKFYTDFLEADKWTIKTLKNGHSGKR